MTRIKITPQKYFFLHISSSYAKILGETNFRTREISRSGSKAKDGDKKRERKRERNRLNDGNNNGQAMHGAHKPPGPKTHLQAMDILRNIDCKNISLAKVSP